MLVMMFEIEIDENGVLHYVPAASEPNAQSAS